MENAALTPIPSFSGRSASGNSKARAGTTPAAAMLKNPGPVNGALRSIGRAVMAIVEGYEEGRRLQNQVMARRGQPFRID